MLMSRIKNPPKEQNDVLFGEIIQKAIKNKKISQATLGDMPSNFSMRNRLEISVALMASASMR